MPSLATLAIDAALGLIAFFLINLLGRFGIPKSYQNELSLDDVEERVAFNILFRIFAPVVFVVIFSLVLYKIWPNIPFFGLSYSLVFYWILRFCAWVVKRKALRTNALMTISQAAISLTTTFYIFWSVKNDPIRLLLPETSDLSFEFILLAVIVFVYLLAESPIFRNHNNSDSTYALHEPQLFYIDRCCSQNLPQRYSEDIALRVLFYAIALVEDSHRSKPIRKLERIVRSLRPKTRAGITTGLMQVKSNAPLTDEESVVKGAEEIAALYNKYLEDSANFRICLTSYRSSNSADFTILPQGFSYDLRAMLSDLREDFDTIMGHRCGTYTMELKSYFDAAEKFILQRANERIDQSVCVFQKFNQPWTSLSTRGYYRLEKSYGFASKGTGYELPAVVFDNCDGIDSITEICMNLNFKRELFFLYAGLDKGIVIFSSTAPTDSIQSFSQIVKGEMKTVIYDFDTLVESPIDHLDFLLYDNGEPKG